MSNRWIAIVNVKPSTWEHSGIYGVEIVVSAETSILASQMIVEGFARFGRDAEIWGISSTEKEYTIQDIEYLANRFRKDY